MTISVTSFHNELEYKAYSLTTAPRFLPCYALRWITRGIHRLIVFRCRRNLLLLARLSCILSFRVHVKLLYRIVRIVSYLSEVDQSCDSLTGCSGSSG